jgi:hypothetical protein
VILGAVDGRDKIFCSRGIGEFKGILLKEDGGLE